MSRTPSAILFRLLLTVVALAPLPLGANRPWAWSLLAVLIGALLAAWGILVLRGRARSPLPLRRLLPVAVPFGLALAWAALQATGYPASANHPLWDEAARALAGEADFHGVRAAVSLDPLSTWTALMRLVCYGGIFWLACQLGRERRRARDAVVTTAAAAGLYGAYGLIEYFSGSETILWLAKWSYPGDLTATFVNRNAYGAYAGLGMLCCLALLIHALRPRSGRRVPMREMVERVLTQGYPWVIGLMVLATALLLSHSRGALLSTGAAMLVLLGTLTAGRVASPRLSLAVGLLVVVGSLSVVAVSGDVTFNRLSQTNAAEEDRVQLNRLGLDAVEQAPLTGHGLGSFEAAFRIYRDASLPRPVVYLFAHDMWLETAMDLGVPGAVLLLGAPIVACLICLRGLFCRHRDQLYPALALALAVLLGAHGLVDFSVQMPAIAATFALLLGVGYAQSWNSSSAPRDSAAQPQ